MLLLVVGLVVLVLVIVVVVFLSVRSMRGDEDEEYPARPARRDSYAREPAGRGSGGRGRASPNERGGRQPGPRQSSQRQSSQRQPSQRQPGQRRGDGDYQTAALPRPRASQHDQDLADDRPEPARRRPRPAARLGAESRDRSGGDWSDTDWGGVSDEQYWAEMSSDKPLATTARSAQAGSPASPAGSDAAREDLGDRGAADATAFGSRREPARSLAGAATTVGLRRQPKGGGQPDPVAEPGGFGGDSFRDEGSFRDGDGYREAPAGPGGRPEAPDTDPGLGGPGGWSGSDDTRTAAWPTQDAARWAGDEPAHNNAWGRQDQPTTAWNTQESAGSVWDTGAERAPAPSSWAGQDDPLTSPSFGTQDGYAADARSYHGSHDRTQGQRAQATDPYGTNGYGADTGYPSAGLEPLPEPGGAQTGPSQTWHSAPVPTDTQQHGYAEPASRSWDQGAPDYQDPPSYQDGQASAGGYGYGESGGYGASGRHGWTGEQHQGYPGADTQSWQDAESGYRQDGDYGYDQNGYGQDSYGQDSGYGYEQPGYGTQAAGGYGQNGYDQGHAGDGYGERGQRGRHGQNGAPGYSPEFDIGHRR